MMVNAQPPTRLEQCQQQRNVKLLGLTWKTWQPYYDGKTDQFTCVYYFKKKTRTTAVQQKDDKKSGIADSGFKSWGYI